MHGRFLRFLVLFLILLLLPAGCNFLFLQRAGELLTLEKTIAIQMGSDIPCLYGTAIHPDNYYYKLKGYAAAKPDTAIIGSSRTMRMAEPFFQGTVYNLGGAMTSIAQGEHLADAMLTAHLPKRILLGVDFWWFNTAYAESDYRKKPPQEEARITSLRPFFLPFVWLYERKLSPADYVQILLSGRYRGGGCFLGVRAHQYRSGFRVDGSHDYTGIVVGSAPSEDKKFEGTLLQIRESSGRFIRNGGIGEDHIAHFVALVRRLESEGIDVTVYMPPLAPTVYREFAAEEELAASIRKLRERLHASGVTFIDFLDVRGLSSNDCEFIDGIHGGDITNARILLRIDEWRRERGLPALARTAELRQMVRGNAGLAMAREVKKSPKPEVDFLDIGCTKE